MPTFHAIAEGTLGTATVIRTGFPSTTASSLVSLCTGVAAGKHGVLGYTVGLPGASAVLRHTDWFDEPDPGRWQPVPSVFDALRRAGVSVTIVNRADLRDSGLTAATTGSTGFEGIGRYGELPAAMLAGLRRGDRDAVVYGYHPGMDKAGHHYGNAAPEWAAAAAEADILVAQIIAGLPHDGALIVTADHGQLDIPLDRRIDIDTQLPLSDGVRLVAGDARARYIHVRHGSATDVLQSWTEHLAGAARVLYRQEAVALGLFGHVPTAHQARIGDIIAICNDDWALVATHSEPAAEAKLVGMHGATTSIEVEVPLIVIRSGG